MAQYRFAQNCWNAAVDMQECPIGVGMNSTSISKATRYPGLGILLFLGWTLIGTVSWARYAIESGSPRANTLLELLGWLSCYYPWLLLTPLLFRLEQRFSLVGSRSKSGIIVLAVASLPLTWLSYVLAIVFDAGVRYAFHQFPVMTDPWWPMPLRELILEEALYWPTVGACCMIRIVLQLRQKERQAAQLALEKSELEASLRRSELDVLRMRLNPHFLFNSLQNVSILTRQDPDKASSILTQLGDLLRASLRSAAQAHTTLAEEIALTRAYVAIEQMRFADRLSVLFEIDPEVERALVPNFLLQPLVENAIGHGLRGTQHGGVIWIRGLRQEHELVLTVSDNGSGPPSERLDDINMGLGLGSTRERLVRMYPGRHSVSMQRLPEGGTEVQIALPLCWEDSPQERSPHESTSSTHRR